MGTEQDVDEQVLWQAADRYAKLRRRFLLAYSWGAIFLIGAVLLAPLCKDLGLPLRTEIVGQTSRLAFVAALVWCLIPAYQLNWFRCPSCGSRFTVSRWGFQPGNRCRHCGLDLGPGRAKVVEMSTDDESEWNRDEPGRQPEQADVTARTNAS